MPTPELCSTCAQSRDNHGDRCPQGVIDGLRARVAELEESNRVILNRKTRLADEMSASEGVSNKLVAEADDARLSAERRLRRLLAEIMPMGRTALLDDGTVRAAIDEIHAMDARADAAKNRVDELLWIESTSCCGDQSRQYGVRARAAEAQVAAVRADLNVMRDDPMPVPTEASRLPDGATVEEAYTAGWYRAIRAHERGLRRALDAATTPPETSPTGPPVT